jgi:hypothetical protein
VHRSEYDKKLRKGRQRNREKRREGIFRTKPKVSRILKKKLGMNLRAKMGIVLQLMLSSYNKSWVVP